MHINEIFKRDKMTFSFEFFPPKTEKAAQTLFNSIQNLAPLSPSYVSVTYGAGGSTRELTHELVKRIQAETGITVVSHLTCVGSSRDEIRHILEEYSASGIENILALRGDLPRGVGKLPDVKDGFRYASELVAFIKKHFPHLGIGVAGFPEGHPETQNRLREMEHLKGKIDAGADYICTQLFFDNRDFYDFCERCEHAGITVPILAGIMPITSAKSLERMAELALGARYPARLLRALERAEDPDYVANVGIHWATEQVRDLIDSKVKGVHFYTLNKSKATLQIYNSLGVKSSTALAK
ncbi:MAG: methylenetetrahydrofolate reductase [NAD(P)H] [Chitinivibrionales bacterium]|nr:methylenetetrahydrofolate reductase [NAD(P)H] [Chitinivibrionales bacterium]